MKVASPLLLATALLATPSAEAQPNFGRDDSNAAAGTAHGSTLKSRFGVEIAETLLKDSDPEQRQRGLVRLGSVGSTQALDLLIKSFESGGAARSARDRLIAVRALAPHAAEAAVREFLVRVMVGVGSNPGRSEAIDRQIEQAAALALARAGDDAALTALGKALRQPGHLAEAARDALLSFPPPRLEPVVQGGRSPSRALLAFLGALGDRRAIPALRDIVRSAPNELRPQAALALSRLGVVETVELARHWLKHEADSEFRRAAAQILLDFHEPDAAAAVERLLEEPESRLAGLELSSQTALPTLAPALLKLAKNAAASERSLLFSALGNAGTHEALSFLGGALSAQSTSSAAALALALAPAGEAETVLESALSRTSTRRAALRASIARLVALGRAPRGFSEAVATAAESRDASDRALAAEARALLDGSRVPELLRHASLAELRAISRAALWPGVSLALADRLAREPDADAREALAACLVSLEAAERVPSNVLLALIDARGLAAALAARALAARSGHALRAKILSLLESDDPLLRSHTALGLGQSPDESALGVLENAYRDETDSTVRLSIVHALGARREPARARGLRLARALDGSEAVRQAANLALNGAVAAPAAVGPHSAWLEFELTSDTLGPQPKLGALIVTPSGLAIPAFADPDRVLLFPALSSGSFELRLAAKAGSDHPASRRSP